MHKSRAQVPDFPEFSASRWTWNIRKRQIFLVIVQEDNKISVAPRQGFPLPDNPSSFAGNLKGNWVSVDRLHRDTRQRPFSTDCWHLPEKA